MSKELSIFLLFVASMNFFILFVNANDDYVQNCSLASEQFVTVNDETTILYMDFTSLAQLNFECDSQAHFEEFNMADIFQISLYFNQMDLFNQTVDLSSITVFPNLTFYVTFIQVKGFDIEIDGPILRYDSQPQLYKIYVSSSHFNFYYRKSLIDEHLCSFSIFDEVEIKLFSGLSDKSIVFEENNDYRNPACPYVFKNANINEIHVRGAEFDSINPYSFSFLSVKQGENETVDLNCTINTVFFRDSNRLVLNDDVINYLVFGNTSYLKVGGILDSVQDGLFLTFKRLEAISLALENMRAFFHSSQNKWLENLFHQSQELNDEIRNDEIRNDSEIPDFLLNDISTSYDFPAEDFCLFKYFPSRRVFATSIAYDSSFVKLQSSNKSITIKFLLRKPRKSSLISVNLTHEDDQLIKELLMRCFNMSSKEFGKDYENKFYFNSRDVTYALKWLEFVGPIITLPIVAACAFILNSLVILVIKNKKNKEEKLFETRMFDYILLNSVFVCLECFICEFKLLNYCLGVNTVYCSSVKNLFFFNVFGRVTGYLGEMMKTCAIVTGLLFSIQRYIEATKTENRYLRRFSQIEFRRIVVGIFAFSGLISGSKVFEYYTHDK